MGIIRVISSIILLSFCTACVESHHHSHAIAMSQDDAATISQTMLSYIYEHYPAATTEFSIVDENSETSEPKSNAVFAETFINNLRAQGYGVKESEIIQNETFVPLSYVITTFDDGTLARLYIDDVIVSRYFINQGGTLLPVSGFAIGSQDDEK